MEEEFPTHKGNSFQTLGPIKVMERWHIGSFHYECCPMLYLKIAAMLVLVYSDIIYVQMFEKFDNFSRENSGLVWSY